MRMKKILLGLVCSLALTACGPAHKSVLEPLTPEEADELAGKYEHFINIYERVIFPKVNKLPEHSLLRQRLEKLTYGDFMEFHRQLFDNDYEERASKEWDKKYDLEKLTRQLDSMTDSIDAYWNDYKENGSPSSYISVEFLDMEKKSWVDDSWGFTVNKLDVSLKLKVTPLKGKIDKLSVSYVLYKGSEHTLGAHVGGGSIEIDTPFDSPEIISSQLKIGDYKPWINNEDYKAYIRNNSVETIKEQCHISLNSPTLIIDGKKFDMTVFYDKIPYYANRYKELRNDTASSDYKLCRDVFIRGEIDKTYYEKDTWVSLRKSQMEYEFNPVAYALFYGEDMAKEIQEKLEDE
ncbi:hypothetical protein POY80_13725 [Bacteroides uniformis]|uniref:Uncharacterized protein n=2 Tax=Bacteroides TaxID=816 RepID=A0A975Q704_9BACE|nr:MULTISPECIES: hypothetical protein [Bacteroidales]MDC1753502.1 hypothetical protein [Bacteroides uniformis]MDC1969735.1 hypothetical protein [Bacteroides uniformis]QUT46237.1 hypothetical protein INE88_03064 [Bacteroides eggerthii]